MNTIMKASTVKMQSTQIDTHHRMPCQWIRAKANSDLDINGHNAIIMIMIKSCDDNSVSALCVFNKYKY